MDDRAFERWINWLWEGEGVDRRRELFSNIAPALEKHPSSHIKVMVKSLMDTSGESEDNLMDLTGILADALEDEDHPHADFFRQWYNHAITEPDQQPEQLQRRRAGSGSPRNVQPRRNRVRLEKKEPTLGEVLRSIQPVGLHIGQDEGGRVQWQPWQYRHTISPEGGVGWRRETQLGDWSDDLNTLLPANHGHKHLFDQTTGTAAFEPLTLDDLQAWLPEHADVLGQYHRFQSHYHEHPELWHGLDNLETYFPNTDIAQMASEVKDELYDRGEGEAFPWWYSLARKVHTLTDPIHALGMLTDRLEDEEERVGTIPSTRVLKEWRDAIRSPQQSVQEQRKGRTLRGGTRAARYAKQPKQLTWAEKAHATAKGLWDHMSFIDESSRRAINWDSGLRDKILEFMQTHPTLQKYKQRNHQGEYKHSVGAIAQRLAELATSIPNTPNPAAGDVTEAERLHAGMEDLYEHLLKEAKPEELDWRPNETIPEDYYSMSRTGGKGRARGTPRNVRSRPRRYAKEGPGQTPYYRFKHHHQLFYNRPWTYGELTRAADETPTEGLEPLLQSRAVPNRLKSMLRHHLQSDFKGDWHNRLIAPHNAESTPHNQLHTNEPEPPQQLQRRKYAQQEPFDPTNDNRIQKWWEFREWWWNLIQDSLHTLIHKPPDKNVQGLAKTLVGDAPNTLERIDNTGILADLLDDLEHRDAKLYRKWYDHVTQEAGPPFEIPPSTNPKKPGDIPEQLQRRKYAQQPNSYTAASPNDQDLSFGQAAEKVRSADVKAFKQEADKFLQSLNLKATSFPAVADWEDGAEPSLLNEIPHEVDERLLQYAAAWQGLLGNQRSVLYFQPHPSGKDSTYIIDIEDTDLDRVRRHLNAHKIPYRTLIPKQKKTRVLVFDQNRKLRDNVSQFAGRYNNASVRETIGAGNYIGGATRSAARATFRDIIDRFEGTTKTPPQAGGEVHPNTAAV